MRQLGTLALTVIPANGLTPRAWRLRDRVRITDAYYVACAEFTNAPIVTCDVRLARAALPGVTIVHVQ
jgi:predicted nucleic acid-binding protein